MSRPKTLGELKASGWRSRSVKDEMRENLVRRLRERRPVFPGLVGYDRTVIPAVQDAILSRHDFILLGLRGQAKTRLLRALPDLLDDEIPVIEGSELNEDPLRPLTGAMRERVEREGDTLPVAWLPREARYHEKLATPDVTVADLIGDVDPIKAATKRLSFSDEGVIHYGIIPRTNRGIFAINELPDLAARIQVGLLNLLEEGDVQIRGFPVRLPLDICLVFSANPEDYTNRGNIITPLRDRIASQILTHYPRTLDEGLAITRQEAWVEREEGVEVSVPELLARIVEQVAFEARESEFVDQSSGVSARMTISLMENVVSSAERRGLITGERRVVARLADLFGSTSAVTGKVELVYEGEREGVAAVALHLMGKAVRSALAELLPDALAPAGPGDAAHDEAYLPILASFRAGLTLDVSDDVPEVEMRRRLDQIAGLRDLTESRLAPRDDAECTAAMELVLEALHQSALLSRDALVRGHAYSDPFDEMARSLRD